MVQYLFDMVVFPKILVFSLQNGWFIMVPNPIKMDDLGVKTPPLFLETPIWCVHKMFEKLKKLHPVTPR